MWATPKRGPARPCGRVLRESGCCATARNRVSVITDAVKKQKGEGAADSSRRQASSPAAGLPPLLDFDGMLRNNDAISTLRSKLVKEMSRPPLKDGERAEEDAEGSEGVASSSEPGGKLRTWTVRGPPRTDRKKKEEELSRNELMQQRYGGKEGAGRGGIGDGSKARGRGGDGQRERGGPRAGSSYDSRQSSSRPGQREKVKDRPSELTTSSQASAAITQAVLSSPFAPAMKSSDVVVVVLGPGKSRIFEQGTCVIYSGAVDYLVGRRVPGAGEPVVVTDSTGFAIGAQRPRAPSLLRVHRPLCLAPLSEPCCASPLGAPVLRLLATQTALSSRVRTPSLRGSPQQRRSPSAALCIPALRRQSLSTISYALVLKLTRCLLCTARRR